MFACTEALNSLCACTWDISMLILRPEMNLPWWKTYKMICHMTHFAILLSFDVCMHLINYVHAQWKVKIRILRP